MNTDSSRSEPAAEGPWERGFLLDTSYRMVRGRAVIHLFGRLESGETFLIRDARSEPRFFVRERDRETLRRLGLPFTPTVGLRGFRDGERLLRVHLRDPRDIASWRHRLHQRECPTYEADLHFPSRFLIDRELRGALSVKGHWRPKPRGLAVDRLYEAPSLRPASWPLQPWVLSLDIETDPKAQRLLSIALSGRGRHGEISEVLLLSPPGLETPAGAVGFADEGSLLRAFAARVRHHDPDVLTGWNVIDFDFVVLALRSRQLGVPLPLGRDGGALTLRRGRGRFAPGRARIPGRVVLDGLQLLLISYIRMERHSLDHVAKEVLGEGKVDLETSSKAPPPASGNQGGQNQGESAEQKELSAATGDRGAAILHAFKHRRQEFVRYNLRDAELVVRILDHLGLIQLAVQRSLITGLPLDRVGGAVAAFDSLYLAELQQLRLAAPSVDSPHLPKSTEGSGGHVLEPLPGLHPLVLVFDFRSLYPSLIRTFGIDPLARLDWVPPAETEESPQEITPKAPQEDHRRTQPVLAPNGTSFRRGEGILPRLLDRLAPQRQQAQAQGDKVASQALKILMNSFYGVLGATGCRFRHPDLTGAITSFGRELLLWTAERAKGYGHQVLYGDTDSLFITAQRSLPNRGGGSDRGDDGEAQQSGSSDNQERLSNQQARQRGEELAARLNADLQRYITERWQVESRLELQFERLFLRLVLLPTRTTGGGARKRYVGLSLSPKGEEKLVLIGMEAVRRDWTALARRVQRQLYQRLFADQPVEHYLAQTVASARAGELDYELLYHKRLRKRLEDYTATSPPHVVAARRAVEILRRQRGVAGARRTPSKDDRSTSVGRSISYLMTRHGPEPVSPDGQPFDPSFDPGSIDREHYVQRQIRPIAEPVLGLLGLGFDEVVGDANQLRLF
ncbi:MAG: DNA polymerase domain-containing protein [Acidobacteriota bacterium]